MTSFEFGAISVSLFEDLRDRAVAVPRIVADDAVQCRPQGLCFEAGAGAQQQVCSRNEPAA